MITATFNNLPTVNVQLSDAEPTTFDVAVGNPIPITVEMGIVGRKGDKGDQGIQGIRGDLANLQASSPLAFNVATSTLSLTESYLPLTGGTLSGNLNITQGDYTLENGAGYSYAHQINTGTNPQPYAVIYPNGMEVGDENGKWSGVSSYGLYLSDIGGVHFGDGTVQTTASVTADLTPYITTATANASFYPLGSNPSGYLTSASLNGYATQSYVNSQGFITASALSPYLTSSLASATYLSKTDATASYYPLGSNPAGYLLASALTDYATKTYVTTRGYITASALTPYATNSSVDTKIANLVNSAPTTLDTLGEIATALGNDANLSTTLTNLIGTKADATATTNALSLKAPSASPVFTGDPKAPTPITSDNDTSIATTAFVKNQNYITATALTPYLTVSSASQSYYPLNSNPSGYLVASNLNDYATKTYVDSLGYITSSALSPYLTSSSASSTYLSQANASTSYYPLHSNPANYLTSASLPPLDYLPLAGGTMTNPNGYSATIDPTQVHLFDGDFTVGTSITSQGIGFNDGTTQTTAYNPSQYYGADDGGGFDINASGQYAGYRAHQTRDDGDGEYLSIGQLNTFGLNFVSEGNPNGDWQYGFSLEGMKFSDGTTQTTASVTPDLSGYLTSATASTTYYPLNSNPSNYLTSSALTGYATQTYVTSQGYLTSSALTGYATQSYVTGQGYITSSALTPYLTSATASATYFPKPIGTTLQYLRGDGSLQTFPAVGDRYLTSSTSTLTIDNGNGKTMTVGTGLSYSPQQDITVSYNTANHMHGTVLTYDSTTGVMTWDSNSHSGSGTYSNWEVNVGGVAGAIVPVGGTAGQVLSKIDSTNFNTEWVSLNSTYLTQSSASSTYQTQSGMSSYLTTSSASSTYLSQSSASSTYLSQSSASSTYLTQTNAGNTYTTKANNLSDLTSASTARTNLGLSALATASFATNAQSNSGTSASVALTPSNGLWTAMSPAYHNAFANNANTTNSSGTGGSQVSDAWGFRNFTGTTSGSYSITKNGSGTSYPTSRGQGNGNIDWSKIVIISGTVIINQLVANSTCRAGLGVASGHLNTDLANKGIAYRISGTGAMELQVHNGTTLYNVTSSFTPTANTAFDFMIYSDGVGNATLYVNDSQVATSANAPTGNSSNTFNYMFCETDISATVASQTIHGIGNAKIYLGR